MEKKFFDPKTEAESVLTDHTRAYLDVCCPNDDIEAMDTEALFDEVYAECARLLTERFIDGKYTIKEYFLVRNELANLLDRLVTQEPNYG